MKILLSVLLLVSAFCCVLAQSGKSGGIPAQVDGKKNSRPTPTPTPEQVDMTGVEEDSEVLRIESNLVTVPVKVFDRSGKFVPGLTRENFALFEDGKPQEIEYFSTAAEPFTVALVLDMSYSAKFKVAEIQRSAIAFTNQLKPKDRVMVVSFDETVQIQCEATNQRDRIHQAIRNASLGQGTSLYDAVDTVISDKLKKIEGRKAVVLFTDGVDTTSSKASPDSTVADAFESEALIFVIQYDTYNDVQRMGKTPPVPVPGRDQGGVPAILQTIGNIGVGGGQASGPGMSREEYEIAGRYLTAISNASGGDLLRADTIASLEIAFSKIAASLRQFYSLGFSPKDDKKDGRQRRLKVKVNVPKLAVKARDSYVLGEKKGK